MTIYSNPRMQATIENWPSGGKRVTAYFHVETNPHGQRAVRETKTGLTTWSAPKKLTYAKEMRIVDGNDGKTYIAELSHYNHITIRRGDMKYEHETVHDNNPRYPGLLTLFNGVDQQ